MLAHKKDPVRGIRGENPLCDLDSAERRKTDVQQNEIGLQRVSLLNRLGAVRRLANNSPFDRRLQNAANLASPWFVVVYNQHTMNQFHERFSRGIFKQLQTAYARTFEKKISPPTTGDRPKLVRCRSCSQLSLNGSVDR